jgi:hypothetical protein
MECAQYVADEALEMGERGGSMEDLQVMADEYGLDIRVLLPYYKAGYKAYVKAGS